MDKFELSDEAKEDIRDISAYTLSTYGERQADIYLDNLYCCLQSIGENPHLGHFRADIPAGYKALGSGRHIIIYTVSATCVFVARILHDSMDMLKHL